MIGSSVTPSPIVTGAPDVLAAAPVPQTAIPMAAAVAISLVFMNASLGLIPLSGILPDRLSQTRAPCSSAPQLDRQRPLTTVSPISATKASPAKIRKPAEELPVSFWAKPSEEAR